QADGPIHHAQSLRRRPKMHPRRVNPEQAFEAVDLPARHSNQAMFLALVVEDRDVDLLVALIRSLLDPSKRPEPLSLIGRQALPLLQHRRPPLILLLLGRGWHQDRKSTRLNSIHRTISYA